VASMLDLTLELTSLASDFIPAPGLKSGIGVLREIVTIVGDVKDNKESLVILTRRIDTLLVALNDGLKPPTNAKLTEQSNEFIRLLNDMLDLVKLVKKRGSNVVKRVVFSKEIKSNITTFEGRIQEQYQLFIVATQIETIHIALNKDDFNNLSQRIDKALKNNESDLKKQVAKDLPIIELKTVSEAIVKDDACDDLNVQTLNQELNELSISDKESKVQQAAFQAIMIRDGLWFRAVFRPDVDWTDAISTVQWSIDNIRQDMLSSKVLPRGYYNETGTLERWPKTVKLFQWLDTQSRNIDAVIQFVNSLRKQGGTLSSLLRT